MHLSIYTWAYICSYSYVGAGASFYLLFLCAFMLLVIRLNVHTFAIVILSYVWHVGVQFKFSCGMHIDCLNDWLTSWLFDGCAADICYYWLYYTRNWTVFLYFAWLLAAAMCCFVEKSVRLCLFRIVDTIVCI